MLKDKVVAIVGIGGIGCVVAQLLSRAGLKKLILIDRDIVDESNIERQFLYDSDDINKIKVFVAEEKLSKFCNIEAKFDDLNYRNIDFKNVDLIIDCTDNIEARLLINDYCRKNKIPWIYTGAIGKIGAIYFVYKRACFNCFNKNKYGDTCNQIGVSNSVLSLVGSLAVNLALDYLNLGKVEENLIRVNLENNEICKLKVKKDVNCETCNGIYDYLNGKNTKKVLNFCSSGKFQLNLDKNIDLKEMESRLINIDYINIMDKYIIFNDFIVFASGRVIIKAENETEARKKYDKLIGI